MRPEEAANIPPCEPARDGPDGAAAEKPAHRLTRRHLLYAAGSIGAAGLLGGAADLAYRALTDPARNNNVFILVADAMRADKLFRVVGGIEVTPNLNQFARDCVRFRDAFGASTQTKTSVPSILSGQYPQYHGVIAPNQTLPGNIPTIPSFFLDRGYVALGITTNPILQPEKRDDAGRGPRCGFAYPFERKNSSGQRDLGQWGAYLWLQPRKTDKFPGKAGRLAGLGFPRDTSEVFGTFWALFAKMKRIRRGSPFFAYLHDMRTHQPWLAAHPVNGVTGRFHDRRGLSDEAVWKADMDLVSRIFSGEKVSDIQAGDRETLTAITDEAAYMYDMAFGEFIARLRRERLYDKATVIFTADHGDQLGEHGIVGHSQTLYNHELAVPFLIRHPGIAPRDVAARVSNASIFATLMELFGAETLKNTNVDSLKPYMTAQVSTGDNKLELLAVLYEKQKIMRPSGLEVIENGEKGFECYDLKTDPEEVKALSVDEATRSQLLRQSQLAGSFAKLDGVTAPLTNVPMLAFWGGIAPDGTFTAVTALKDMPEDVKKQLDALKALGYLH